MSASSIALDEEALCNLVENYPHLWDQKNSMYKDKTVRENAWQSIAVIMETGGKFFKNLFLSDSIHFLFSKRMSGIVGIPTRQIYSRKKENENHTIRFFISNV